MEGLIEKFHNLGGTTISEHKKNFNAYKAQLANVQIDLDAYFSKLQPRNRQEEIFKIKLLQHHERHGILYEILKTGDVINSSVILKNTQFLRVFAGVSGADFAQKICPELSYVNRVKIVNRLGVIIENSAVARDYFESVKEKYGLKTAAPLLINCAGDYVKSVVENYDLRISQALVIRLHVKHPWFLEYYYGKFGGFDKHEKLGRLVAISDLTKFRDLLRYGAPKLGKRGLKKFLQCYKLEVLKYPNLLTRKRKVLLQNLSKEEYLVYFRNLLPKSVDDFEINLESLRCLKALPKAERANALFACFKTRYGIDLSVELMTSAVFEILPSEDRLRFDLDDYPEMLPTCRSVPKLQAAFLATSNRSQRLELGAKLLKTCEVNGDDAALLQVLGFFCEHFNPLPTECFRELIELPLELLSAEHWDYINELRRSYEINYGNTCFFYDPIEKHLLFKMLNGKDYVEDLKKECEKNKFYNLSYFEEKYTSQKRDYIVKLCEILHEIFEGVELKTARNNLIHVIIAFNKQHPKNPIPLQAYMHIIRALTDDLSDRMCSHFLYTVKHFLTLKYPEIVNDEAIVDGLIRNARDVYWDEVHMWYLKHRVDLVEKYCELFLQAGHVHYELSKMHYSSVYKVMVETAMGRLQHGGTEDVACSIKFLSHIKAIDVRPLIEKYMPDTNCRIDTSQLNMPEILSIQRAIISSIKNATPPSHNIARTLHFCRGDYLKYALEPLYHTINHSPESAVQEALDELLTRAVSVRKHTLHLITSVGTTENKYAVMKKFAETETNASLKMFTFRKLLNCFLEERSEPWFGLLKDNTRLLSTADWDTSRKAFDVRNVPGIFYEEYVGMIWREFETRVNEHPFKLLKNLRPLSDGLSRRIITESLYNKHNNYRGEIWRFVRAYLLADDDADFNCIKPPESNTLQDRITEKRLTREFLEDTCGDFLGNPCNHIQRKLVILEQFGEIFKGFEYKLLINITKLLLEAKLADGDGDAKESNLTNYEPDEDVLKLLCNFVLCQQKTSLGDYGGDVIPIFGELLQCYLRIISKFVCGSTFYLLLRLVEVISVVDARLCVFLLPRQCTRVPGFKKRREELVEKLRKIGPDTVGMYLGWFLENCEKSHKTIVRGIF